MQASRDVAAAVVYTVTVHPRKLTNSSSGLRGGGGNATVDNSRRMLIAVTTCNNAWLVDRFLELSERPPFVDYVIIDDYSQDDVAAVAEKHGVRHVRTLFPRGLTYGWNIAYKLFRNEGYEFLVISNNDVVIPRGAMASMQAAMREHPEFSIVGPLTHPRGLGGRRSRVSANVTEHFCEYRWSVLCCASALPVVSNVSYSPCAAWPSSLTHTYSTNYSSIGQHL